MPKYSLNSIANLSEAHPKLQKVFYEVIKHWDCTIIDGKRTRTEQEKNVARGVSKTMHSKHLEQEDGFSHAVDVGPYPVNWNDPVYAFECRFFAGFVLGIATSMGIKLRYGGDWDSDKDLNDQTFNDLVHFELVEA